MRTIILTAAALAAMSGTASSQVIQWNNNAGGSWNTPANWLPADVPDTALEAASIAIPGGYTVVFDLSVNPLGGLSILNPAATLEIQAGRNLRIDGPTINDGLLLVNPTNAGAVTDLGFDAPIALLTGGGTIRLSGVSTRARLTTGTGATLDHGANHTIEGFGLIVADMTNAGTVGANEPSQTLALNNSVIANSGRLAAINMGLLDINTCTITQTGSGDLTADGGSLRLASTSVTGGTIDTLPGGDTVFDGHVTLTDVTLNGPTIVNAGLNLELFGGLTNNGTLGINPTNGGAVTSLIAKESLTIDGAGTVRLSGVSTRSQVATEAPAVLTLPASQTIEGFGRMVVEMINLSDVEADAAAQILLLDGCVIDNRNRLGAVNGATLDINNNTIDQTAGGQIEADGGTVRIAGTAIAGGSIDTMNGGSTIFDGAADLSGVSLNGPATVNAGLTINVFGGLTNNGTLEINPVNGGAVTSLVLKEPVSIDGTGTVRLGGFSTRSQVLTDVGGSLTLPPSQTIGGFGRMVVEMTNNSMISADVTGQTLFIDQCMITNNGTIEAINGATLDVNSSTIAQAPGGRTTADAGTVLLANTDVEDGSLESANGGTLRFDGPVSLTNVTIDGPSALNAGLSLDLFGSLTNNGTLTINTTAGGAVTSLFARESLAVNGTGTLLLNGFSTRAQITTDAGVVLTLPASQVVRGYGRIVAAIDSNTSIAADVDGQTIFIDQSTISNSASLAATNGATLDVNSSMITQTPAGRLEADGGTVLVAGSTVAGGRIESDNGGAVRFDGSSTIDGVTIGTDVTVVTGVALTARTALTNHGTLAINPNNGGAVTNLVIDESLTLDGTGTVHLGGITVRSQIIGDPADTLTQGPDHTISGIGRILIPLTNHGTIAPGSSVGRLESFEPIGFTDTAVLDVEVRADEDADLIDSSSTFHADGTLRVTYIDGFDPTAYWGASIVTADAGVTGRFDAIDAPVPADDRLAVRVRYLPDEIRIGAVCKPDINFDGQLNFFDISAFIALYNVQDPDADVSAPFGVWNFFDIAAYIGQYNTGCP
tara:strand:- start:2760 stop:5918 length:3159 start_codon:yes stop_codon:yes gene_type:complete